jgi:hypothetical protein
MMSSVWTAAGAMFCAAGLWQVRLQVLTPGFACLCAPFAQACVSSEERACVLVFVLARTCVQVHMRVSECVCVNIWVGR